MLTGLTQFALVVSPALPVNSVKDLIALAKSKPGELTYASSGIVALIRSFAKSFKTMTGTDIQLASLDSAATRCGYRRTPSETLRWRCREARNRAFVWICVNIGTSHGLELFGEDLMRGYRCRTTHKSVRRVWTSRAR